MGKKAGLLDGYKTYIVGALTVLTGLVCYLTGQMDQMSAWKLVLAGFGVIGFRSAIKKIE